MDCFAEIGIVIPEDLMTDCVRLCCTLCLMENNPEMISPDVLADDRAKFEQSQRPEVRGQGPSTRQSGLGCWQARRGYAALPPPAHDLGLDGTRAGGASHCSKTGQRGPPRGRGKGADGFSRDVEIGGRKDETARIDFDSCSC